MPLKSANRAPLQDLLAVPAAKAGRLLQEGQSLFELQVDVANNFVSDMRGEESIKIDGERTTVTLRWQKALNDRWQFGVELPWIYDSGGCLDSLIQNWHELWGLPNAGRESAENDQLRYHYRYSPDAGSPVDLSGSGGGIGDLKLQAARSLFHSPGRALSLHGQLKLPTGESKYLRSSGSTDVALGLSFADDINGLDSGIGYYLNGGGIWLGGADVADSMRRPFMAYGSIGITWGALSAMSFKLQLDARSSGYDTRLSELNESVQLVVGGTVRMSEHWLLDVAASEDLLVDTAPDVLFLINLIYQHDKD